MPCMLTIFYHSTLLPIQYYKPSAQLEETLESDIYCLHMQFRIVHTLYYVTPQPSSSMIFACTAQLTHQVEKKFLELCEAFQTKLFTWACGMCKVQGGDFSVYSPVMVIFCSTVRYNAETIYFCNETRPRFTYAYTESLTTLLPLESAEHVHIAVPLATLLIFSCY